MRGVGGLFSLDRSCRQDKHLSISLVFFFESRRCYPFLDHGFPSPPPKSPYSIFFFILTAYYFFYTNKSLVLGFFFSFHLLSNGFAFHISDGSWGRGDGTKHAY